MKELVLKFNLADSEYLTAVRLVTGAVCSVHEVDLDTLEDFKVCVTESAIILKNCGFDEVEVTFGGGEKFTACVEGFGGKPEEGENELSLALISALVGGCEIERRGEIITKLTLEV